MPNDILVKYREGKDDKPDWWELYMPINQELSDGTIINVPSGYVTDFASVPPLLWSICPPIGKYNRACLVHDYLYDRQYKQAELGEYEARKRADFEFLRIANESDPNNKLRHYLMYSMVRRFGRAAWRKCKS
jgi:hypothetical protein